MNRALDRSKTQIFYGLLVAMRFFRRVFLAITIIALTLAAGGRTSRANSDPQNDFEVVVDETITLEPENSDKKIGSRTVLNVNSSIGEIDFNTTTTFETESTSNPLVRQEFDLNHDIGEFTSNLKGVFDSSTAGLNYLLQQGHLEKGNLSTNSLILLEYVESESSYGSGLGLEIDGSTNEGTNLSASLYFGMDRYLKEIHDPTEKGSGYYIIDEKGSGLSEFPFGSALIEISDLGLGECRVANRTKFMRGEGLLFSGFSFDLIKDKGPLNSRAYVYFTSEEKTITLVPTFLIQEEDWRIVADFGGTFGAEAANLEELEVRGAKFSSRLDEHLRISGITSLAGKMKKEKGASQIYSRAEDYKLSRSFDEIAKKHLFEKVKWSDVFSLEYDHSNSDNRKENVAIDFYLRREDKNGIFGLQRLNGLAKFEFGSSLTARTGIELSTEKGLDKITLNLVQEF